MMDPPRPLSRANGRPATLAPLNHQSLAPTEATAPRRTSTGRWQRNPADPRSPALLRRRPRSLGSLRHDRAAAALSHQWPPPGSTAAAVRELVPPSPSRDADANRLAWGASPAAAAGHPPRHHSSATQGRSPSSSSSSQRSPTKRSPLRRTPPTGGTLRPLSVGGHSLYRTSELSLYACTTGEPRRQSSPPRPVSRGSLVQLDGDYLFFSDGGRSAAATLANQWKRPTTTRGASYAQFASMLHIASFHEQLGELGDAMQEKGVVTNLDKEALLPQTPSTATSDGLGSVGVQLDPALQATTVDGSAAAPEEVGGPTPLAARLTALFAEIDVNGDGALDPRELATKLKADAELQMMMEVAGKHPTYVFEQLDVNGDGTISRDEFIALVDPPDDEEEEEEEEEEEQEEGATAEQEQLNAGLAEVERELAAVTATLESSSTTAGPDNATEMPLNEVQRADGAAVNVERTADESDSTDIRSIAPDSAGVAFQFMRSLCATAVAAALPHTPVLLPTDTSRVAFVAASDDGVSVSEMPEQQPQTNASTDAPEQESHVHFAMDTDTKPRRRIQRRQTGRNLAEPADAVEDGEEDQIGDHEYASEVGRDIDTAETADHEMPEQQPQTNASTDAPEQESHVHFAMDTDTKPRRRIQRRQTGRNLAEPADAVEDGEEDQIGDREQMEDGTEGVGVPSPATATDTAATRKKTRGALLGGLRSGALEQAVSKMEADEAAAARQSLVWSLPGSSESTFQVASWYTQIVAAAITSTLKQSQDDRYGEEQDISSYPSGTQEPSIEAASGNKDTRTESNPSHPLTMAESAESEDFSNYPSGIEDLSANAEPGGEDAATESTSAQSMPRVASVEFLSEPVDLLAAGASPKVNANMTYPERSSLRSRQDSNGSFSPASETGTLTPPPASPHATFSDSLRAAGMSSAVVEAASAAIVTHSTQLAASLPQALPPRPPPPSMCSPPPGIKATSSKKKRDKKGVDAPVHNQPGVHIRVFYTEFTEAANGMPGLVTIELLGTVNLPDAGCCRVLLRTEDRAQQAPWGGLEPCSTAGNLLVVPDQTTHKDGAVTVSATSLLAGKACADVIELRMMTNASTRGGREVGRVLLPVALLQSRGNGLGAVTVWLPAPPPPPMLHISMHRAANDAFGGISVRLRHAFGLPNDPSRSGICDPYCRAQLRQVDDSNPGVRRAARAAFIAIDVDVNGVLDREELRRLHSVLSPGSPLLTDKETDKAIVEIAGKTGGLLHKRWHGGSDMMGVDFGQFFVWFREQQLTRKAAAADAAILEGTAQAIFVSKPLKNTVSPNWNDTFTVSSDAIKRCYAEMFERKSTAMRVDVDFAVFDKNRIGKDGLLATFTWVGVDLIQKGEDEHRYLDVELATTAELNRQTQRAMAVRAAFKLQVVTRAECQRAFDQIDVDNSGLIDREELRRLNSVLHPGAPLLNTKQLDAAILDIAGATGGLLHTAWRGGSDEMGIDVDQFFTWYSLSN
jgi:Ca2+-binding EF-hand superfamily protein